jgi:hypothetical protein
MAILNWSVSLIVPCMLGWAMLGWIMPQAHGLG